MKKLEYKVTIQVSSPYPEHARKALDKLIRQHLATVSILTQEPEMLIESQIKEIKNNDKDRYQT
jgi:ABC-type hemin transport system substrate-binding protein